MAIKIRLIDADEDRLPLFDLATSTAFPDPIHIVEVMFVVPKLVIPVPGEYRLQVLAMDQLVQERRLVVASTEGGTP